MSIYSPSLVATVSLINAREPFNVRVCVYVCVCVHSLSALKFYWLLLHIQHLSYCVTFSPPLVTRCLLWTCHLVIISHIHSTIVNWIRRVIVYLFARAIINYEFLRSKVSRIFRIRHWCCFICEYPDVWLVLIIALSPSLPLFRPSVVTYTIWRVKRPMCFRCHYLNNLVRREHQYRLRVCALYLRWSSLCSMRPGSIENLFLDCTWVMLPLECFLCWRLPLVFIYRDYRHTSSRTLLSLLRSLSSIMVLSSHLWSMMYKLHSAVAV